MNYNILEIEQAEKILHDQVKNTAILPWVEHLLKELRDRVKFKGDLSTFNMQEDMLRNANNFKHYIKSAMSDIVGTYELLLRHYQNEKKADEVFDKIINGYVDSDLAIKLAAQDMVSAASLIKNAMYLITNIQYINKENK